MKKVVAAALKVLSTPKIDLKKYYKTQRSLQNLRKFSPLCFRYKIEDCKISVADYEVPLRLFYPETESKNLIVFIHGGGWVTGSVDSYQKLCTLLSKELDCVVASIEYRLAPEYKFPIGLEDCYGVVKAIYCENLFEVDPDNITLMGDSAGGNMAAVISLLGRDRGDFHVRRQMLFYPLTHFDHSDTSPFLSVFENGYDYVLTNQRLDDYLELYMSSRDDFLNPYFAPLLMENLENQPQTLLVTAEFDPLRDEGEAYARRLEEQGNTVVLYRMEDSIHGFLGLSASSFAFKKSIELMKAFLEK